MRAMLIVVALAGCRFEVPSSTARVRRGPLADQVITPLAAMPTTCTDDSGDCNAELTAGVRVQVQMEMELAGLSIFDAARLNAEMRERATTTTVSEGSTIAPGRRTRREAESMTSTTIGRTWADLSRGDQSELLIAAGVNGIIYTDVTLGEPQGWANQQEVTVRIAIVRASDRTLAKASQCTAESGLFNSKTMGLETATQCAIEAMSLW